MNRIWLAAGVAVVNSHPDQGHRWKSGLSTFPLGMKRAIYGGETAELQPVGVSELTRFAGDDRRRVAADESLQKVMYMNCWGQG